MLTFNKNYFAIACLFFLIEVLIALYITNTFIRSYLGDVLVVILIYCFLKSLFNISVYKAAIFVLLFSFTIETFQYFNIVEKLGLQNSRIAKTVIGTSFSWFDILAYIAGIIIVVITDTYFSKKGA